jgi:hypothetical protein
MQRPVMNPAFFEDASHAPAPKRRRWWSIFRPIGLIFKFGAKVLFFKLFSRKRLRVDDGLSPVSRFTRGLFYRLAFLPLFLALAVGALVFAGTHPLRAATELDPSSQGIYYEAVTMLADDGVKLDGWLVPVVDASVVLRQKDDVLRHKHPAVVLVHDFGNRRQQMLPLIKPLHNAGFVVLVVGTRGGGPTGGVGATFGLKETMDVRAAVTMARRRPYVNADKVAVVGIGTGATAALLAARDDAAIPALVLANPTRDAATVVSERLLPRQPLLHWMTPLCKWTFEMAYQVDIDDIDLARLERVIKSRPVLQLDERASRNLAATKTVNSVRDFLQANVRIDPASASAR